MAAVSVLFEFIEIHISHTFVTIFSTTSYICIFFSMRSCTIHCLIAKTYNFSMKCEQANMVQKISKQFNCIGQKNNSFMCVELRIIVY